MLRKPKGPSVQKKLHPSFVSPAPSPHTHRTQHRLETQADNIALHCLKLGQGPEPALLLINWLHLLGKTESTPPTVQFTHSFNKREKKNSNQVPCQSPSWEWLLHLPIPCGFSQRENFSRVPQIKYIQAKRRCIPMKQTGENLSLILLS